MKEQGQGHHTSGGGCVESIHAHPTVCGLLPPRGVGTVGEGAQPEKPDSSMPKVLNIMEELNATISEIYSPPESHRPTSAW